MSVSKPEPTGFAKIIDTIEQNIIATLLGLMTLVTFANVVLRYGFGDSLLWGLEVTLILFAWLVLFGISYGFKISAHLGVDAVLNIVGSPVRRILVLLSALCCIAYEETFNLGEEYEKLPRFIPYVMLPLGVALMLFRIFQATGRVWRRQDDSLIASHEAEEAVEEAAALNRD